MKVGHKRPLGMDSNLSFISSSLYLPQSFPSPPHPAGLSFLRVSLSLTHSLYIPVSLSVWAVANHRGPQQNACVNT